MSRFFDQRLAALAPYTPGEQPREARRWIKLNTNESPFPPAPGVAAVLATAADSLRLYPDPTCGALRQAAAARYRLSPQQVFAANGRDEVLAFCFRGLCPQGALFPDLTYGFYPVFCRMFGVRYQEVPLDDAFCVRPADYQGRAGTIFLANPNAPSGLALSLAQIETLLAQDRERLVVVDEAYVDFGAESALGLLARYDNLLVTQTFSKSRALAGGRLGLAFGSEALIADLERLKYSFNPYSVNRLTLLAGEAALQDEAYFRACCDAIMANRALAAEGLRGLGCRLTESLANFLLVAAPGLSGAAYQAALREAGILVRYFDQPRIRDYVRISIGSREEMLALLAATRQILERGNAHAAGKPGTHDE